jgi:hypothetical protein
MTSQPSAAPPSPAPTPTIHEAERASGPSGAVLYGAEIDFDAAVARRRLGEDAIVRGEDRSANRRLAERIEAAIGPAERQDPHPRAGPLALPHYQQKQPPPHGHTFYETERRKGRKRP